MDVYTLSYPDNCTIAGIESYSLAIGFFDGLHKGHQAVIRAAKEKAEVLGIRSAVMTFNPHPSHLFGGTGKGVNYITPFPEKIRLLDEMGIDALFIVTFDWPLASLSPKDFVTHFIKNLRVKHVTGGFDFTFGSKGSGTMESMAELSEGEYGTTVIGKVSDHDEKISSTRIRRLLAEGKVEETKSLLGRPIRTAGKVVGGEKRGRLLGFPTANIQPDIHVLLPANGVYAVLFTTEGKTYKGVCNIGVKPTFHKPDEMVPTIEVHLLDFDGDLYGQEAAVDWIQHIRSEQKFNSIEDLTAQIAADKKKAYEILENLR